MSAEKNKKVLILHGGGIGDLLLALPAVRIFRQNFPQSKLELMGRPERLSLIAFDLKAEAIHSIDQVGMAYFYLDDDSLPADLSNFFSSFGVILIFGKSNLSILAENLRRTGVDKIIPLPSFPPEGSGIHVSEYLVQCLRASGLEGENKFYPLLLPADALAYAEEFWAGLGLKKDEHLLAIHPGSGSPAKNWPAENFVRVADGIGDRARILLISGPAQDGVEEVRRAMKRSRFLIAENLPLLHLAALLKRGTAYLGNDSGITHLAALLGLPTVAVFGPTDPAVWGPKGPGVRILSEKNLCSPCPPETRLECSRHCLEAIQAEQIIQILSPFFNLN